MESRFVWFWEGPRWAKVTPAVKDVAARLGLRYTVDVDKGWITERGRITVEGDRESGKRFIEVCNKAMAEYNKD